MKVDKSITQYFRIELDRLDMINAAPQFAIPDDAIIRFYDTKGRYYDISEEYPIVISFEKKVEK